MQYSTAKGENKMTTEEFNETFHGVIGPAYAGARYPRFDRFGINEKNFAHELRCKYADIYVNDEGVLIVKWCCQDPFQESDRDDFDKELIRCAQAIGYAGNISVRLFDRDGYCDYGYGLMA
jgi:hypothetical protein